MLRIFVIYVCGIGLTLASCKGEPKVQAATPASKAVVQEKTPIKSTNIEVVEEPETKVIEPNESVVSETKADIKETAKAKPVISSVKKPTPDTKKVVKNTPKPASKAKIDFANTVFEFGEIDEGDTVEHVFEFKNTGSAPLNIVDVSASCGCTVPSYPIMPIEPGGRGKIGVLYNSKGKFGTQKPFLTIKSNATDPLVKLYLSGSIKHVFEKPAVDTSKTSG